MSARKMDPAEVMKYIWLSKSSYLHNYHTTIIVLQTYCMINLLQLFFQTSAQSTNKTRYIYKPNAEDERMEGDIHKSDEKAHSIDTVDNDPGRSHGS